MNELYKKYSDRAEFYVVYIREAHAADSDWPITIKDEKKIYAPKTMLERMGNAHLCVTKLNIDIPCVVDGLDGVVANDYDAWPDRVFVVDENGLIAVRAERGPWGFEPGVAETAKWLEKNFPGAPIGTH